VRRAFAVLAVLTSVWGAGAWLLDGVALSIGRLRVSSSDSIRPLIAAASAAIVYVTLSGPKAAREDVRRLRLALTPRRVALLLTSVVVAVGIANNSWAVGGSDSYSYASQMDLWLRGELKVPVRMASEVPWPDALATFTPFGYAAVARETAIAPITPPGLPLLMAAFKSMGSHAAAFLVVPLTGGLLVWSTFLLGRRLGSDRLALAGAWLVATSPTFLMMFKSQMSDVPAAAFWTVATYWILGTTVSSAVAAGLAASLAILIRPNLLPLAAVLAGWTMFASQRRRLVAFAFATLPGCLVVAAINNHLFGSPLTSGYGELSSLFAAANIDDTISSYLHWLVETHTPLVFAGIGILATAPSRLSSDANTRCAMRLLALLTLTTWVVYAAYPAFDAWWFLRFLLPSWPAMFIGTAAFIIWLFDHRGARGRLSSLVLLVALGAYGLVVTAQRHVFVRDEGERRYATIAHLVAARTEPSAMIFASIHAGSLRYYAGRATLRFDLLDPSWLDRAAEWLNEHGRHPYVLIEDWEMPLFRGRFGAANTFGELRLAPVLAYKAYQIPGRVYLFDLLRADGPTFEPPSIRDPQPRCPAPADPPAL
jgi:hypothetical protein